jgi:hypothetical protein
VSYPGARGKATSLWLLPADESALDSELAKRLPARGWLCSHPGPVGLHEVHLHGCLLAALDCGGVQAFMPLPVGWTPGPQIPALDDLKTDGRASVAILQFLRSEVRTDERGEHFSAGRLAVRWFENEVGPELHATLSSEVGTAWAGLRAMTNPAKVQNGDGSTTGGMRIGTAAKTLVLGSRLPLTRGGWERLSLT